MIGIYRDYELNFDLKTIYTFNVMDQDEKVYGFLIDVRVNDVVR